MVDIITIFGTIAMISASAGFLPQVIRSWKTKKMHDLSFYMIALWLTSAASWVVYGLARSDIYIIITNVTIFSLVSILLGLKFRHRK